jgi:hypothetical protein
LLVLCRHCDSNTMLAAIVVACMKSPEKSPVVTRVAPCELIKPGPQAESLDDGGWSNSKTPKGGLVCHRQGSRRSALGVRRLNAVEALVLAPHCLLCMSFYVEGQRIFQIFPRQEDSKESLASLTDTCTLSSTCCTRLGPGGREAAMAASRAAVTVSVLDNGITGVTRERAANAQVPCWLEARAVARGVNISSSATRAGLSSVVPIVVV